MQAVPGYTQFVTRFNRDLLYYLQHRPDVDLESLDHATGELPFDLGIARDNKVIHSRSGDRIFIVTLTGVAYIRTKLRGNKYKLRVGSISLPFKKLYLTNTAQAGKNLIMIIGYEAFIDFAVSYLAVKILNVADAEINPSTEEKQDTTIAQLDIKLSALRDAITDTAAPKDLKDLYDQLYAMRGAASPKSLKELWDKLNTLAGVDFATQTTLALIKAKTDNLTDLATQTTLALIKAKTDNLTDLASQATLALIKAKTDNLNLSISALRDAICDTTTPKDIKDLWDKLTSVIAHSARINSAGHEAGYTNLYDLLTKLESLKGGTPKTLYDLWDKLVRVVKKAQTPTTYTVTMTNADTEYSQALPDDTAQITFLIRGGGVKFLYAWTPGKVGGTPSDPYTEVPANGIVCLDKLDFDSKTLYFSCGLTGRKMQIEVLV